MAGDIWEQAVETYLAMDRGLFLNPEYFIGTPKVWEGYADFLAIEFRDQTAWMVEVTKKAGGLRDKIKNFARDYEDKIRQQLKRDEILPKDDTRWKIGFWAFVPERDTKYIEELLTNENLQICRVTALEETLKPEVWEKRFRG